ncbi:hypothetical protein BST12_29370, partial [Mycobacterium angelicum]
PHTPTTALPTYPFQHRPYWLTPAATTNVTTAGLDQPDHPLLGAVTPLTDQDQVMVLTGRLSPTTHPWLGSHRVQGTPILPAAVLADLLLYAGGHADCPVIEELLLQAPVVLADESTTDVQITVHPVDETHRRPFTVHSRTSGGAAWVLHATGTLSAERGRAPAVVVPSVVEGVDVG